MTHQPGVYVPLRALFLVYNCQKKFNPGGRKWVVKFRNGLPLTTIKMEGLVRHRRGNSKIYISLFVALRLIVYIRQK